MPAHKGRALEDVISYVFGRIPGVTIPFRDQLNTFESEEIDLALWNDQYPKGLRQFPTHMLIESKNWSHAVGSIEVSWFDSKLRGRGLTCGIFVAANGVTGSPNDLTASRKTISDALRDGRVLLVVTKQELAELMDTAQLVQLLRFKWCELIAKGTTLV